MFRIWPDAAPDALSNAENPTSIAVNGEELFKKWWLAFLKKVDNSRSD